MTRRLAAVLVAASLAAVPAVASAASPVADVSLSGAGNTSAIFDVRRPLTLSLDTADGGMRLSGRGTYIGIAVHDRHGALVAAAVHPRDFMLGETPLLVWVGTARRTLRLGAGEYTLTVVSDAPGVIRVRASGLPRSVALRTTRTAPGISASTFDLTAYAPAVSSGATQLRVTQGATATVAYYRRTSAPSEDESWFCLRVSPGACSATNNDFRGSSDALSPGGESVETGAVSTVGAAAGTYDAAVGFTTLATQAHQAGFAIAVPSSR